jgi:hypothetical protein
MSRSWLYRSICLFAICFAAASHAQVGVRVLLGVTDQQPTVWDGSVSAQGASITRLDPWRFGKEDDITGSNSWKASTRPVLSFLHLISGQKAPVGDNGVIVWLDKVEDNTELQVKTAQGDFTVRLSDIPYGKFQYALGGRAAVDRIPPSWQLTNSPDEQDYPAAVSGHNGEIWLAYQQFQHAPDHDALRAPYTEKPKSLDKLTELPGGDQILVQHFVNNKWSQAITITPAGGDLYRPAIALDGQGRAWVFWSDNKSGKAKFELWARPVQNETPGTAILISKASGSDVFPVATSDAQGRVWVAWQGWRDGKAAIFSATQQGDKFSVPQAVSNSTANEWNPSISADPRGKVAVAWDSYRNGSYDVYARIASGPGNWGNEIPVAATARYEAYPSIAYDQQGVLWIAYEEGSENWGKDFGAHDTTGVPLYHARVISLVGLNTAGRLIKPSVDPGTVLPGEAVINEDAYSKQSDAAGWNKPDPTAVSKRAPNAHPWPPSNPRNSLPRLQVDRSGRLWLAFRSNTPSVWGPLGTSWSEYVTSFNGQTWTPPIYLFRSDNTLDNRPALVSRNPGDLVVIESSDARREVEWLLKKGWDFRQLLGSGLPDPYNNDLYASILALPPAVAPISGRDIGLPRAPSVIAAKWSAERVSVKGVRDYRIANQGKDLRIVRGEFHRHSEISMDGGLDGTLIDQWRYLLDVAAFDWAGCCDHDNGGGREYSWWTTQKLTDVFYSPGKFAPLFSYERSVSYPEGHRNVLFAQRGVRVLPRLPITKETDTGHAPDTQLFYEYLKKFNGVTASHTSATSMGTDWRDNDPEAEPVVEIYQGMRQNYEIPDGPRSNSEKDSIGGWKPKGFINLALERGYKLGFEASSDHISTHQSYANVIATADTREAILDALKKRHIYAATDNIIADVRSGNHLIGDEFSTDEKPEISVKLVGTAPFSKVVIVKDNNYVYTTQPGKADVVFKWRDFNPTPGKTSYYYVRGEQANGEIVWASPFWITYTGK